MDTLTLGFYADAALTQRLPALALSGREGRFLDNHITVYVGSPDVTKKWVSANGNSEISLYGSFDSDRWQEEHPSVYPPGISNSHIRMCLDADYVIDDENCFHYYVGLPGEIRGGVGNAIAVHVGLLAYQPGNSDYFRLYTDTIEELEI